MNVHPAKLEVRLLRERAVAGLIYQGLRQSLRRYHTGPAPVFPPAPSPAPPEGRQLGFGYDDTRTATGTREETVPYAGEPLLRRLTVIGWLPPVYILAHGDTGLYIIDAHAAHERILFERYLEQMRQGGASQFLLPAQTVELEPRHEATLERYGDTLRALGLVLEPFGGRTYLVKALPHGLRVENLSGVVLDFLTRLENQEQDLPPVERVAAVWACRAAVSAGERMAGEAALKLIQQLASTTDPWTCPHGRPTVIAVSYEELARRFHRGRHEPPEGHA